MDPQHQFAISLVPEGEEGLGETLVNNTEYVEERLSTNYAVPGRLKKQQFSDLYEEVLKANAETMVRHGCVIPFESEPPASSVTENNGSCIWQAEFAFAEMLCLKALGCVREVDGPSRVELPLCCLFLTR